VDHARAKRHDFFLARMVKLPRNLTAGSYTLKVTIVDQQAQRMAEGLTPVVVAGQ